MKWYLTGVGIVLLVILGALLLLRHSLPQRRRGDSAQDRITSSASGLWWDEETAVAWSAFGIPSHDKWLGFVQEVGTTICDRGVFYDGSSSRSGRERVAEYYHSKGLRVTSFFSIEKWKPVDESVQRLIGQMQGQLDDGCDGVHLDMLFAVEEPRKNVDQSDAAARAVEQMRDAVHSYRRDAPVMFAGNSWVLDTPFALLVATLCDVAWIESWGRSDLELVRIARVARSLGGYRKPAWYHWQPHHNEQSRVTGLMNLPKALYASCLLEGAVFLCNYQYPVPLVTQPTSGDAVTEWRMFEINDSWRQSVLQYARFAKEHGHRFREAQPMAPVLVAFKPGDVRQANRIMRDLLRAQAVFNVAVGGKWPLTMIDADDLRGYPAVVTPDVPWIKQTRTEGVYGSAAELMAVADPRILEFCRVQGNPKVIVRIYEAKSQMLIGLKQYGYAESVDGMSVIGPFVVSLYCPERITSAICYSPDRPGHAKLAVSQEGPKTEIIVPKLEYFNLIVLDLQEATSTGTEPR